MGQGIPSLPAPVFVNDADGTDPNLILAEMIAAFESSSGRRLQPAQVERLLIDLYAYRESLVRNAVQYAAQQNLLAFAIFPMIDYLGGLVGVTALASATRYHDDTVHTRKPTVYRLHSCSRNSGW